MTPLAPLLLAAALATGAAPDVREEIRERQDRFQTIALELESSIARMREIRLTYPDSGEKELLAARWDAAFRKSAGLMSRINVLRSEHRSMLKVVNLEVIALAVPVKGKRRDLSGRDLLGANMIDAERRAAEMRAEATRLNKDLELESAAFNTLLEERKRHAEKALPLWGAAVVGTLALAAALFALRRPPGLPAEIVPAPALTGRTVSHANIELGELLGRGAMGEVYAGRDRTLDRRVAVKRLRPELSGSPVELEKLVAQARQMAGLKHPGIVQVHSVERDGGEAFLVLELAEGRTLAKLLAEEGPLPWEDARRIVRAVAEALDYAHVRGVLHSDLKPSNIMVAGTGSVKVMDFALAYAAKATVSRLTRSDAFGGLPYMSPEQELGDPGPAADAFALAACFYEALTGKRPFPGPNFLEQKRAGRYAPASSLAKGLPAGADSLFRIAFHPDPDRRFPGPAALAAAADAL